MMGLSDVSVLDAFLEQRSSLFLIWPWFSPCQWVLTLPFGFRLSNFLPWCWSSLISEIKHMSSWGTLLIRSYSWAVEVAEGAASWAVEQPLCLATSYLMTFLHVSGVGLLSVWGCRSLRLNQECVLPNSQLESRWTQCAGSCFWNSSS